MITHLIAANIVDGAAPSSYVEVPDPEDPTSTSPLTIGATISAGGMGTVMINTRLDRLTINIIRNRWPTK